MCSPGFVRNAWALAAVLLAAGACRSSCPAADPPDDALVIYVSRAARGVVAVTPPTVQVTRDGTLWYAHDRRSCALLPPDERARLAETVASEAFRNAFDEVASRQYEVLRNDEPMMIVFANGRRTALPIAVFREHSLSRYVEMVDALAARHIGGRYLRHPLLPTNAD